MTACMLHKSQKSKLNFATLDKESNMSTLLRREEFLRICNKEELAEKAQDIKATIPVTGKKGREARYNLDPGSFFGICFWDRRRMGSQSMRICRSYIFLNSNV